jgi:hypothetical protein
MKFGCFSLIDETVPLQDGSFDVVIDKGTLDAIYPHSLKELKVIE